MINNLHGRFILLVYGEIDLLVIGLQDALDRIGAQTAIARTPADALVQLKRRHFDGALINYLPGLDPEHRELLRALAGLPALLLCTALAPLSLVSGLPTLVKPIEVDSVLATLARLLHLHPR